MYVGQWFISSRRPRETFWGGNSFGALGVRSASSPGGGSLLCSWSGTLRATFSAFFATSTKDTTIFCSTTDRTITGKERPLVFLSCFLLLVMLEADANGGQRNWRLDHEACETKLKSVRLKSGFVLVCNIAGCPFLLRQGRIQQVRLGGGSISVIFGKQVSLRVNNCKRGEICFTTLLWQSNEQISSGT